MNPKKVLVIAVTITSSVLTTWLVVYGSITGDRELLYPGVIVFTSALSVMVTHYFDNKAINELRQQINRRGN